MSPWRVKTNVIIGELGILGFLNVHVILELDTVGLGVKDISGFSPIVVFFHKLHLPEGAPSQSSQFVTHMRIVSVDMDSERNKD